MVDGACAHAGARELSKLPNCTLYLCGECGLIFNNNYADHEDPGELYKEYYANETAKRFNFGVEALIRTFRFFRAIKLFTIHPSAKTVLDVGSGRGFMLYFLRKYFGYRRAAGVQISRNAVEFSRKRLGLEIHDRDLLELDFEPGAFDLITMWHVLEHLTGTDRYLAKLASLLAPGGRLVIEVPNFHSWTRAYSGQYWLGLDPEFHRTYFHPEQLVGMLRRHGLEARLMHTFSLEYSTFISVQSIVSRLTGTDHLFFRFIQEARFSWPVIPHALLFLLLTPACFLVNLLLYFSGKGEVLLVVAEKPAPGGGTAA